MYRKRQQNWYQSWGSSVIR